MGDNIPFDDDLDFGDDVVFVLLSPPSSGRGGPRRSLEGEDVSITFFVRDESGVIGGLWLDEPGRGGSRLLEAFVAVPALLKNVANFPAPAFLAVSA